MTDDVEQWSDEARADFVGAAAALQTALAHHGAVVSAAKGDDDLAAVFAANDALAVACDAYDEAQFMLTGTFTTFESHDVDDEDLVVEDEPPASSVMFLSRDVYGVTSETEIIEAGRRAHLRVWPGSTRERAEADVTTLGNALYEITHDGGLGALASVDGLRSAGRTTWIVTTPTAFTLTLDDLMSTPFELDEDASVVHRVDDVR